MNFTRAEPVLNAVVAPVVDVLVDAGADPARLMLLGAVCRDALHVASGHEEDPRSTGEVGGVRRRGQT